MRTLAILAFSFGFGVFSAHFFLPTSFLPWVAGGLLLLFLSVLLIWHRPQDAKRKLRKGLLLLLAALAVSQLWFWGYTKLVKEPVTALCGQVNSFAATVCDYPTRRENGWCVSVRLMGFHGAKAVYYGGEELSTLEPGQLLTGTASWQDAGRMHENEITTFTARGVYALLFSRGDLQIADGARGHIRYFPQRAARAIKEKITAIYGADTLYTGFVQAELTGDKTAMPSDCYTKLTEAGLAHLFAVSGLHCAFLVTLLGYLIPANRRRLSAVISIAVLLLYMCLTGLTPSVVRACIMQIFLLIAPLFYRKSDGLTSLGAALAVILLCNPFAIGSVSLLLSFSATFGLVWLSPKLMHAFRNVGEKWPVWARKIARFVLANFAVSVSALAFTVPVSAYYFNSLTLIAPLSNLLIVWAAGWNFMWSFLTVSVGFLWPGAAQVMSIGSKGLILYVQGAVDLLTKIPFHTVYFTNRFLRYWLVLCYGMFAVCFFSKNGRRIYVLSCTLSAVTLVLAVALNAKMLRAGSLQITALDVGQGESVLLYSGADAALVDCGSSNGEIHAGTLAAQMLDTLDYPALTYLAVTHYHADHTNGIAELLEQERVKTLLLPDVPDETGAKEQLLTLAQTYEIPVQYITGESAYPLGEAELTIYPPLTSGETNEEGLSVLCSTGAFDALITGDMSGETEMLLTQTYALPDIEVLLVSHHGSRYSSKREFLAAITPEASLISVGRNSYGHPNDAALLRLEGAGSDIYRTDLQGNITVMVQEESK